MAVGDSHYYETFKHLNAEIIKPSVAEVNKMSNLIITPELRKTGRAVSRIRFKIAENPQLSILDRDDGEGLRNSDVYPRLRGLGVTARLARQWIKEHGEAVLSAKLDYVLGREGVRNAASYLARSLVGSEQVSQRNLHIKPVSEHGAKIGGIPISNQARRRLTSI
ncbi:Protein involved in initiation of plasmid replication [Thalassobacter stenotrophicus]|uniref:Protein involved in initiation of plasmid replication n=2 Tax=Thalassobacter stenotrophicus TaxID=266809 RepID=A0A0P1FHG8_9RHOB|nr:Protein involved in initiation of plasmid replication [Thalassobacter stenotrophicus]SHJ32712.1 Initiator Replication protein [Thalassobacter stenotrophicus DSM 16310]